MHDNFKNKWVITSIESNFNYGLLKIQLKTNKYALYMEQNLLFFKNNVSFYYSGYILEREQNAKGLSKYELLYELYIQYGVDFIKYIKGNFVILIFDNDKFYVFSDRFGVKKFFTWSNDNSFIISNDLKLILQNVSVKPSLNNIAI